jgi:CheY-like chemotaxis protein
MAATDLKERAFTILLAEDNEINLVIMRTMFAALFPKARLLEASNGEIAFEKAKSLPDIVFMDLHMPLMNGFEATASIRRHGLSDLPVIALTASNTEAEKQACLETGMNDVLVKPVSKAALEAVVSKFLPA